MYPELKTITKIAARTWCWIVLMIAPAVLNAQTLPGVSEIITDYNGWWKSGSLAISPVKPDNSHNLLAFTYNGTRYSTGANDDLLRTKGQTFVAGNFRALPVSRITGTVTSNTKIGLGAMYDGVANGAPATKPENNMVKYLTDGVNGLDLGTCVANLPAGDIFLPVNNLNASKISDGIPDLLITQVADPSGSSLDRYEFTDINGTRIGNSVEIVLNNLPVMGNWTADFYDASTNPMSLSAGFAHTDRPIRLWAADFSAFGINASQIPQIAYFKIRLNGNSDVAFVAYNNTAVDVHTPLPATLASFQAKQVNHNVEISWKTITESNTSHFNIEASTDGVHFTKLHTMHAAGNTTDPRKYSWIHLNVAAGKIYYRLQTVDKNGSSSYSTVAIVTLNANADLSLGVYPNPATEKIYIKQNRASGNEVYQVRNLAGVLLMQKTFAAGSMQHSIDVSSLIKGTYLLTRIDGAEQEMVKFIKH